MDLKDIKVGEFYLQPDHHSSIHGAVFVRGVNEDRLVVERFNGKVIELSGDDAKKYAGDLSLMDRRSFLGYLEKVSEGASHFLSLAGR